MIWVLTFLGLLLQPLAATGAAMGFCRDIGTHVVFVPGSAGPGTAKTQITNVCSKYGLTTAGESLMYLIGAAALPMMPNYSQAPIDLLEAEIGGTTCATSATTYATYDALGYDSRRLKNAYALSCGFNSFNQGRTTAQIYSDMLAVLALAEATGFSDRLLFTVTSASLFDTAPEEALRVELNDLITDGAIANDYTAVDVGTDANLGCDGCYTNATYFTDGTHYTSVGQAIKADLLATALEGLGYQ